MKAPDLPIPDPAQMMAADEPVPWLLILLILFGSAIVSWGITEAIKLTGINRMKYEDHVDTKEAKRRMWWSPMLVLLSMLIGAAVGAIVGGYEWKPLYGSLVGAVGGALASWLVKLFKKNLSGALDKAAGAAKPKDDE